MNFTWSYSRKKNYQLCPRRHYHYDVLKDIKQTKTFALTQGDNIHSAFQRRVEKGLPMPTAFKYLDKWGAEAARKLHPQQRTFVERQIAITRDLKQTTWYGEDVWYRSKIDLIKIIPWEKQDSWVAIVIDYKTGEPKDEMEQLALYATVVFIAYPEVAAVRTEYWWTKPLDKSIETFTRENLKDFLPMLLPELEIMEQSYLTNNFPATPNGLCRAYCDVYSCEYNGRKK